MTVDTLGLVLRVFVTLPPVCQSGQVANNYSSASKKMSDKVSRLTPQNFSNILLFPRKDYLHHGIGFFCLICIRKYDF